MRTVVLLGYCALLAAQPAPGTAGAAPRPEVDAGLHKLYVRKCGRCHELYHPARYNDEDWDRWMEKMTRKARLSAAQSAALAEYLATLRTPAGRTNDPPVEP